MFGKKVKLKWNGDEFELNTTFELAADIDEEINILKVSLDIDGGEVPKITTVAKFYSILLRHAGSNVSASEIYESILSIGSDSASLINAARFGLNCLFPEIDSPERPQNKNDSPKKK
jgi:hypothetical protein